MAKQLNVSLAVTANTGQARSELTALQTQLTNLVNSAGQINLTAGLNTSELSKAITMTADLSHHLKEATNVNTGNLNFSSLQKSLTNSKQSIADYGRALLQLGPQGQQAFNQLATAISKSEVPLSKANTLLGQLGTTLMNTARWQLSSSMLHGFMGAISGAYSYAQRLNESLNRIQIVTQATDEHMARFAENANKAAQRLSTTTTSYTNASLIYYQQGLSDKEVAERTEATIKLANVSGQSAEKVSNQMTAIWNNFADGSKSLESYADVITALGAATASSSEEIATGLQKFASVADTVGLSYENATAALATITATTRQSADTVGTGLRTLFARLQSLNLGETLDDGVTLTKYTKALEKIGVDVLDVTGNMRSMDDILADMGAKWQNLTDAQKTATAQTVGGVRQYTTLMALMENFDKYQENLNVAKTSEGTVQKQADIYAKSWEAAQKRLKASSEAIVSDVLDDKAFIGMTNFLSKALNLIDAIVDRAGGLKSIFFTLGAYLMKVQSNKATQMFTNGIYDILSMTSKGQAAIAQDRQYQLKQLVEMQKQTALANGDQVGMVRAENLEMEVNLQQELLDKAGQLSAREQEIAQMRLDGIRQANEAYAQMVAKAAQMKQQTDQAKQDYAIQVGARNVNRQNSQFQTQNVTQALAANVNFQHLMGTANGGGVAQYLGQITALQAALEGLGTTSSLTESQIIFVQNALKQATTGIDENVVPDLNSEFQQIENALKTNGEDAGAVIKGVIEQIINNLVNEMAQLQGKLKADTGGVDPSGMAKAAQQSGAANVNRYISEAGRQQAQEAGLFKGDNTAAQLSPLQAKVTAVADGMTQIGKAAMNTGMAVSGVTSLFDSLTNSGLSAGQKITSAFMTAPMIINGVASSLKLATTAATGFQAALGWIGIAVIALTTVLKLVEAFRPETEEEKLERLGEESDNAKQSAVNASAAYDELLNKKASHNELLDTLDTLTASTNRFKTALQEANALANDIITANGLRYGTDYYYDNSGVLRFQEGVMESVEASNAQFKNSTATNSLVAQMTEAMAQGVARANAAQDTGRDAWSEFWMNDSTGSADFVNQVVDAYRLFGQGLYGRTQDSTGRELTLDETTEIAEALNPHKHTQTEIQDFLDSHQGYTIEGEDLANYFTRAYEQGFESWKAGAWGGLPLLEETPFENWQQAIGYGYEHGGGSNYAQAEYASSTRGLDQYSQILQGLAFQDATRTTAEEMAAQYLTDHYDASTWEAQMKTIEDETAEAYGEVKNAQAAEYKFAQEFGEDQLALFKSQGDYASKSDEEKIKALQEFATQRKKGEAIEAEFSGWVERFGDSTALTDYYEALKTQTLEQLQNSEFTSTNEDPEIAAIETEYAQNFRDSMMQEMNNIAEGIFGEGSSAAGFDLNIDQWRKARNVTAGFKDLFKENADDTTFADALRGALFDSSTGVFNEGLADALSNVDLSSQLSALFDLKSLSSQFGEQVEELYNIALEAMGGEVGVFSEIFGSEDFQKELKKVQKEFKKTGKISTKNVDEIAESCDELNEALDQNILSAGAVADALELYSSGAIDSIDEISDELWDALDAANSFVDALRDAFNYIDSWNPDRSISDIGDFYGKVSKDYFEELKNGTTGSERLYQDAAALGGDYFATNLRKFFYNQEGIANVDDPKARAQAYNKQYGNFDAMWQKVQESGNMQPFWQYMLGEEEGKKKGTRAKELEELYGRDVQGALKQLGLSTGKNGEDIEWDIGAGMTTDEAVQGLMSAFGVSEDIAKTYFSELTGHSAALATDFQVNDFLEGAEHLIGENGQLDASKLSQYVEARGNNMDVGLLAQSLAHQYGIKLDENAMMQPGQLGEALVQAQQGQMDRKAAKMGADVRDERFASANREEWDQWLADQKGLTDAQREQLKAMRDQQDELREQAETYDQIGQELETQKQVREEITAAQSDLTFEDGKVAGGLEEGSEAAKRLNQAIQDADDASQDLVDSEGQVTKTFDGDQLIGKFQSMGMTAEQAFENAQAAAESAGGQLSHSFTDAWGNVHTAVIENCDSIEEYQQKCQEAEQNIAHDANVLFGKQLFEGMLEGIQELGTEGSELATKFEGLDVKLPISLELKEDAVATLKADLESQNVEVPIKATEVDVTGATPSGQVDLLSENISALGVPVTITGVSPTGEITLQTGNFKVLGAEVSITGVSPTGQISLSSSEFKVGTATVSITGVSPTGEITLTGTPFKVGEGIEVSITSISPTGQVSLSGSSFKTAEGIEVSITGVSPTGQISLTSSEFKLPTGETVSITGMTPTGQIILSNGDIKPPASIGLNDVKWTSIPEVSKITVGDNALDLSKFDNETISVLLSLANSLTDLVPSSIDVGVRYVPLNNPVTGESVVVETGKQSGWGAHFDKNDQNSAAYQLQQQGFSWGSSTEYARASGMGNAYATAPGDYRFNNSNENIFGGTFNPTTGMFSTYGDRAWEMFNQEYVTDAGVHTGMSLGSMALGTPFAVQSDVSKYSVGENGQIQVELADGSVVDISDASAQMLAEQTGEAVAENAEGKGENGQQPGSGPSEAGGSVRREGSGEGAKVTIGGKEYDAGKAGYSETQLAGLISQFNTQKALTDSSTGAQKEANQLVLQELASQLTEAITAIEQAETEQPTESAQSSQQEGQQSQSNNTVDATAKVGTIEAGGQTVELSAIAEVTEANAEAVEPVPVDSEAEITEAPIVEPEADTAAMDAEIAETATKPVELDGQSDTIDTYLRTPGSKIVNLYTGFNGPKASIDALPSSKTIDVLVNITVTGSNSFQSSFTVSPATGGQALGAAVGGAITDMAVDYAMNLPQTQQFIEETGRHYLKGAPGCQSSLGQSRTVDGDATGSAIYRSYVNGSANRYLKPGLALTAEEGPEIVWNKNEGYSYIVGGDGHPEFTMLRPGDRVFNANDTRQILNYHRPKSNVYSAVKDPREMSEGLFGSHAKGSAYGSYGPDSNFSSGGGHSSGNANQKTRTKNKEYDPERYHLIIRQVQDLTFWYNELEKARDRAYGVNVAKAIDKEIKATQELIFANKQYLDEINDYLPKDQEKLRQLLEADGMKLELDANGNVKNFEEIQNKYGKAAAGAEDWMLAEDADKDAVQAAIDFAKERMDALAKYEETLDKYQEIYEDFTDYMYQLNDLRLEKITAKVEMEIEFDDRDIKILEHYLKKLEDDAYSTADAITNVSRQMAITTNKINSTKQAIKDIFEQMNGEYGNRVYVKGSAGNYQKDENGEVKTDWNKEWFEYVQTHADNSQQNDEDYMNRLEEQFMHDYGLRTLKFEEFLQQTMNGTNFHIDAKWGEALEEQIDNLLSQVEDLEQYRTYAAELIGKNYDKLAEEISQQLELFDHYANSLEKIKSLSELQGVTLAEDIRKIAKAVNDATIEVMKSNISAQKDHLAELYQTEAELQNLIAHTEDEQVKAIYEERLRATQQNIRDTKDAILTAWERGLQAAKESFEKAMEDVVKVYDRAISNMYGSTSLLNNATDRARDIADQYVGDYEKFYQLTKLERTIGKDMDERAAKGIKNNTKLQAVLDEINKIRASGRKVSQDELDLLQKRYDIAKAESDLEDARNAKQTVRLQRDRNGNWGYVYTAQEDDELADLEQARDDSIYEYQKALTESMNSLSDKLQDLIMQRNQQMTELQEQFNNGEITEEEFEKNKKSIEDWFNSQSSYLETQFTKFAAMASNTVAKAKELYSTSSFDILDKFSETVIGQVNEVDKMRQMIDISNTANAAFLKAAAEATAAYQEQVDELNASIGDTFSNMNDFETWANNFKNQVVSDAQETAHEVSKLSTNLSNEFSEMANSAKLFDEMYHRHIGNTISDTEELINNLEIALDQMNGLNTALEIFDESKTAADNALNGEHDTSYTNTGMPTGAPPKGFDTGGYTGVWGPDGRLAFLHQKEQVFNADDTQNLLQAAKILQTLDLQTNAFSRGLGALSAISQFKEMTTTIEQEVTIHAEFPNATNHNEIEQAFDNLVNKATQYANRKVG